MDRRLEAWDAVFGREFFDPLDFGDRVPSLAMEVARDVVGDGPCKGKYFEYFCLYVARVSKMNSCKINCK